MNRNETKHFLLCAAFAIAVLPLASPEARADKRNKSPSPQKLVIVENMDPIPITGEVDANVIGTVPVLVENVNPIPVEGSVLVANPDPVPVEGSVLVVNPDPIPAEGTVLVGNTGPIEIEGNVTAGVTGIVDVEDFNSQLNSLKSEVRQVREAVEDLQGSDRNPWTWVWERKIDPLSGRNARALGVPWEDTQLITISVEDDTIVASFYDDTNCEDDDLLLRVGARADVFPKIQTINLPVPLDIRCVRIFCSNIVTPCEVFVTMVGSRSAP